MSNNAFNNQYISKGLAAQRLYPNESLLAFIGGNFFSHNVCERSNIKILEIGCGSGANLWMIAKEGFDTYGIDASEVGINLAQEHLFNKWGLKAYLKTATFEQLPFGGEEFDAVCDVVSLQHIDLKTSKDALTEVYRVLKQGASFFSYRLSDASTMYQCSGGEFIDEATVTNICDLAMPLSNNGVTAFWSPTLTRKMYTEVGFKVKSIERISRTYNGGKTFVEYLSIVAEK